MPKHPVAFWLSNVVCRRRPFQIFVFTNDSTIFVIFKEVENNYCLFITSMRPTFWNKRFGATKGVSAKSKARKLPLNGTKPTNLEIRLTFQQYRAAYTELHKQFEFKLRIIRWWKMQSTTHKLSSSLVCP